MGSQKVGHDLATEEQQCVSRGVVSVKQDGENRRHSRSRGKIDVDMMKHKTVRRIPHKIKMKARGTGLPNTGILFKPLLEGRYHLTGRSKVTMAEKL